MNDGWGSFDWAHAWSAFGGAIAGAIGAIGTTLYRAGGKEPNMRLDIGNKIMAAEQRLETKIDAAERRGEDKVEGIIGQFHDSFASLRQKINDVELQTERGFVAKPDFEDFRAEYREDKNRMFEKLDRILGQK